MHFDSFRQVLGLLHSGSALPWRRLEQIFLIGCNGQLPVTVEKRDEVGGSGEKPDPAEEGEDDEEGGGGGGGDDEGEGDHGGC